MMALYRSPNKHSVTAKCSCAPLSVYVTLRFILCFIKLETKDLWQKPVAFSLITVFLAASIRSVKDSSFVGDTEHSCLE